MIAEKKPKEKDPVFMQRRVPSAKEVKAFEEAVNRELHNEEIEDELSEIYDEGSENIRSMHLKPRGNSILVSVLKKLFVTAILVCSAYGIFFYLSNRPADATALEFNIAAPQKVKAGEEFEYVLSYHNKSKLPLKQLQLELKYPDNFIFKEAGGESLQSIRNDSKNIFILADLAPGQKTDIKIRGSIIDKKDAAALLSAGLSYNPGDFSSEFKKEAVSSVLIETLGFDVDFEYANAVLAGEKNGIDIYFKDVKQNFMDDFEVSFMFPENISLINDEAASSTDNKEELLIIEKSANLLWKAKGLVASDKTYRLPIYYQVNRKVDDNQEIIIRFNKKAGNGKSYTFLEKNIKLNVMNSDLNLTLILNGSKNDGVANFGDTLNYSLVYANKSENQIDDVTIMAILKSDFLDWNSVKGESKGFVSDGSIVWSKEQIPSLASLAPGAEGVIDFSINLNTFNENDLGKNFTVSSVAQFSISNRPASSKDSKSNVINTKLNSDLTLIDKVLYFDDNNTPVGSGPLPPKAGEQTAFRVYWTLKNNLHDLSDVIISMPLPDNVDFNAKNSATAGLINFDSSTRSIVWNIADLPVSTYRADAEFDIIIRPSDNDRDRIMVLSPGVSLTANDKETKATISKKNNPKTTKLEDDDIASLNNSGRVQ